MNLVEILSKLDQDRLDDFRVLRPIYLANGRYWISVQASKYHYCTPRATVDFKDYTHFELMPQLPPADVPPQWRCLHSGDGIYSHVPKEELEELLKVLNAKYEISMYHI